MEPYKIHIMQYARREAVTAEMVLGDLSQEPFEMGYFMWAITNGEHTVVVDMGFTEETCSRREGRIWLGDPAARMRAIDIDPGSVEHVIVTHLHYDHVGNYELFPHATFYLQADEMAFWTGPYAKYKVFNRSIEVDDVVAMVRYNYAGRVAFVAGSQQIVPGVTVHRVSGHTKGMQIVSVETKSGTAVLASDAAHCYRNLRENTPFLVLHDIPNYLDGFELMRKLASSEELILPGHDAAVMENFPKVADLVAVLE